ncbi:MAG: hypothetical protein J6A60_04325 [Clostridia bacterium]|nr:hypothetical protein [Clostridia bacterium]
MNRKTNKILVFLVTVLIITATVLVALIVISQKKPAENNAPSTTVREEETYTEEESEAEEDADYMAAYNRFLKEYNGGEYGPNARFELVYFTDDDIPELFVSPENAHAYGVEIMTYRDGEVVKIYEGGSFGELSYIEREGIALNVYVGQGTTVGSVVRIGSDGSEEVLFSYTDNSGAYPPDSGLIYYEINGEKVSYDEYAAAVEENVPNDTSVFSEGIPLTEENIDEYCR